MAPEAGPLSTDHEKLASDVGYRKPPAATRFQKGQSGNPRGRPRNRHREIPYNMVLGQMVTIREDGRERRVTAAEAFLLQLTRKGLQGDSSAARASLQAIEAARAKVAPHHAGPTVIRIMFMGLGVNSALRPLGIAEKRFPLDEKRVRWELKPWIVQAALARLGTRQLTIEEQRKVLEVTRDSAMVSWPKWWTVRG